MHIVIRRCLYSTMSRGEERAYIVDTHANCRCSMKKSQTGLMYHGFSHCTMRRRRNRMMCQAIEHLKIVHHSSTNEQAAAVAAIVCIVAETMWNWIDISIEANWLLCLRISHTKSQSDCIVSNVIRSNRHFISFAQRKPIGFHRQIDLRFSCTVCSLLVGVFIVFRYISSGLIGEM